MSGQAVMRAMIELGLTDKQKLVLLDALALDSAPSQSPGAERQRRYRQRQRERDNPSNVTSNVTDERNAAPYEDTSTPLSSEPSGSSEVESKRANPFPKPEWADRQVWSDFLANRKRRRMQNTVTAYRGFLADIEKFSTAEWPPGRLLEHAVKKGWGGIYDPTESTAKNGRQQKPEHPLGKTGAALERVLGDFQREDELQGYPGISHAGTA